MKKNVVRLTESDLIRLIKKVIKESEEDSSETSACHINCMPGPISRGDAGQVARMNCCKTKMGGKIDKNSAACQAYIKNYNKDLDKCSNIIVVQ